MRNKQESIAKLINASKPLIPAIVMLIDNYPELLQAGIAMEFKNAVWELDNWVNEFGFSGEDVFKQMFLQVCAARDSYIANSLLSYSGLPDSPCNTLFWEITRLLFPQNTLISQIKVLMPSVTHAVQFDYSFSTTTPKTMLLNYALIPLEQSNIDAIDLRSTNVLKEYVVAGSLIIDVKELISLPFALHLQWYSLLQKNQPALLSNLVQHNDDLRKLHTDLQLISQGGLTPNEAITHLMNELKRSGERLSGDEFALAPAPIALAAFFDYLNSLPEALREEVLILHCPGNKVLADILDDLQSDKCVQTAADELLSIIENKANAKLLVIKPHLTQEQVQAVYNYYTHGNHIKSINSVGNGGNGMLPKVLRRELYDKLYFEDIYELIDFLQIIPLEDYPTLLNTKEVITLCNSPSNTEEMGYYVDVLNAEQLRELFICLVKYGIATDCKIVSFIQQSNHPIILHLLPEVLTQYREHHLVQFVTQVDSDLEVDDNLLEWLEFQGSSDHLQALQAILLLLLEKSARGEIQMVAANTDRIFRRLAIHAWPTIEAIYNHTTYKGLLCNVLTKHTVLGTPLFNLITKARYQTDDPAPTHRFILTIVNQLSPKALADFIKNEKSVIEYILGSTYPHNITLMKACFEKLTSYQLVTLLRSDCLNHGGEIIFQGELLHFVFADTPYKTLADELVKSIFVHLQPAFLFALLHEQLAGSEEETTLSIVLQHIGGNRRKHAPFAWEYISLILQNLIHKSPNDLHLFSKVLYCTYQSHSVLLYLLSQVEAKTMPFSLQTMQLVFNHLPDNPCHNLVDEVIAWGNKKCLKTLWSLEHPVIAMRHKEQLEKSSHKQKYGTFFAEEMEVEEPNKKRKIEDESFKM